MRWRDASLTTRHCGSDYHELRCEGWNIRSSKHWWRKSSPFWENERQRSLLPNVLAVTQVQPQTPLHSFIMCIVWNNIQWVLPMANQGSAVKNPSLSQTRACVYREIKPKCSKILPPDAYTCLVEVIKAWWLRAFGSEVWHRWDFPYLHLKTVSFNLDLTEEMFHLVCEIPTRQNV